MIALAPGNFNHDNCYYCETGMRYRVSKRLILIGLSVLALLLMACSSIPFVGGGAEESEGSDFATTLANGYAQLVLSRIVSRSTTPPICN